MDDVAYSARGLSEEEAARRLSLDGPNELVAATRHTLLGTTLTLIREPMTLLLLGCGALYLVLADVQESLMLLGFVLLIVGITLFQERKTERALDALRDLASPRALVIRDGHLRRIPGREVVRDDVVILAEGDRVPADVELLECTHLTADESLLTGESVPVRKIEWDGHTPPSRPRGDDLPFAFAGTLVVEGGATAQVYATGAATEIGRIGEALRTVKSRDTGLQRETRGLVTRLAWIGGLLSVLVTVAYGALRSDWTHGVLAGLTLAMAVLPNEFPVVVTAFLALGALRLSRLSVLARSIPAVESLGAATVLCVDKTGTLTENRMRVARLLVDGEQFEVSRLARELLPDAFHEVVEYAILASRRDPFDPMERAFHALGNERLQGTEHLHPDWEVIREYPLSKALLAVVQVWRPPGEERLVVAAKGAPEAVASLCALSEAGQRTFSEGVAVLASAGLRVIAVAQAQLSPEAAKEPLPETARGFRFQYVGLVGLADPVRADVPAAVRECRQAGIRIAMITGDYPATAEAIAREIALDVGPGALRGDELARLDDAALRERVRTTNVFARVLPEQKLRLVQALQSEGEVVAMTGDGVNDAPALRAADIGIAMGARGTDVAREAAALVLLKDDFGSLVAGVRTGRRIMQNLRKALAFILAIHLPIVGLTILPIAFGWPLVLLPVHIAFLHLIIDPACSVVFEAEPGGPNLMRRPPRNPRAPLFGRALIGLSVMQGLSVLVVVIAVYAISLQRNLPEAHARALTFTTLIIADVALIFTNRSWSTTFLRSLRVRNPWLWWIAGGAIALLLLVLYVPGLSSLFRFLPPHRVDWAICVCAGMLSVGWFELAKMVLAPDTRSRWRRRAVI